MSASVFVPIACGCCCISVVVLIILIITGFGVLEVNEYGIEYDAITMKINDQKTYKGTREFLGIGKSFIKFDATLQELRFRELPARTKDGLLVELEISAKYELIEDEVPDLYRDFGVNFNEELFKISRSALRDAAAEFTAFEFYAERETVAQNMREKLVEQFAVFHVRASNLEMENFSLPESFNNAVEKTISFTQLTEQAKNIKKTIGITYDTQVQEEKAQYFVTISQAKGQATALELEKAANADAITARYAAEIASYGTIQELFNDKYGDFSKQKLLEVIYLQSLETSTAPNSIFDVQVPATLLKNREV